MKALLIVLALIVFLPAAQAEQSITLANDVWPPFILQGEERGTSEKLVCEALNRSGWSCNVETRDWEAVLEGARAGTVEGIAAAWKTPAREEYLLFSEPYLTNRIVPVVAHGNSLELSGVAGLAGKRVAMVTGYAYGEELEAAATTFKVIPVRGSAEAIQAILSLQAEVALVDELVVRALADDNPNVAVRSLGTVLAYRELFFAVSRQHPRAEEIIDDFHTAYEMMLKDGAVNEALGVDWLATDLGNDGTMDLVLRKGVSFDDLDNPTRGGSAYALDQADYSLTTQSTIDFSNVTIRADGKSHSTVQAALVDVFGKDVVCEHQEYSSTFDCSKLFQKR